VLTAEEKYVCLYALAHLLSFAHSITHTSISHSLTHYVFVVGYYMATLEAATEHIVKMGDEYTTLLAQSKLVDSLMGKSSVSMPRKSITSDNSKL
jgi:hypothetical protein